MSAGLGGSGPAWLGEGPEPVAIAGGAVLPGPAGTSVQVPAGEALRSHFGYYTVAAHFDPGTGRVMWGDRLLSVAEFVELLAGLPGWAEAVAEAGGVPKVIVVAVAPRMLRRRRIWMVGGASCRGGRGGRGGRFAGAGVGVGGTGGAASRRRRVWEVDVAPSRAAGAAVGSGLDAGDRPARRGGAGNVHDGQAGDCADSAPGPAHQAVHVGGGAPSDEADVRMGDADGGPPADVGAPSGGGVWRGRLRSARDAGLDVGEGRLVRRRLEGGETPVVGRGGRVAAEGAALRGRGSRRRGGAAAAAGAERDNVGAGAHAAASYRASGRWMPGLSKERLDAFLDTVWARREDILVGGIDAYELYSGHEPDHPRTVSAQAYTNEVMAIAVGRPAGFAALVQDHGEWPLAESSADTVAKADFIQFRRPDALATFPGRRVYVNPRPDAAPALMRALVWEVVDDPDASPVFGWRRSPARASCPPGRTGSLSTRPMICDRPRRGVAETVSGATPDGVRRHLPGDDAAGHGRGGAGVAAPGHP